MTITYKILGQSSPSADTNTTAYTLPANTQAVVSTISICNTNTANVTADVHVVPNGGSIGSSTYIVANNIIISRDTMLLTLGVTLGTAGDTIQVRSNSTAVSFNIFGSEIT